MHAAVGYLNLLQQIYTSIIIPQAVYDEMTGVGYVVPGTIEVQTLPWIQTRKVRNRTLVTQLQTELDPGESGDRRFHAKFIDGVLYFPGLATEH